MHLHLTKAITLVALAILAIQNLKTKLLVI
jgi:hypothetical protein